METTKDEYEHARENALASMASIREMVERLQHAADGYDEDDHDAEECPWSSDSEWGIDDYHDEDAARTAIEEDALSVQVRSGWHDPGGDADDEEFEILLTTGGPALRIVGEFGEYHSIHSARLEMQDWFIPWQEVVLDHEDYETLRAYCEVFYLGD